MRLAFRFSYLGDRFFGSQMQPGLRTVEGAFIEACRRLSLFVDWRAAGFQTAGRTDRGVHAAGQVCAFDTDEPERAVRALNLLLPRDIWCTGWAAVPDRFHPRYDAKSRTYRYYFADPPPRVAAMDDAARAFCGTHDFASFARADGRSTVRTVISARVYKDGDFVVFEATAESFLWNMVRCMATALDMVGRGKTDVGYLLETLEGPGDRRFHPALPEGLILWYVEYGLRFEPLLVDERSRTYLSALRRRHALMEKVTELLDRTG
ncbi:MAG: tRNA pseudouridine(38-40) synthase TruA [Methanomicrobiaceae archaeon]|uniref:Trna pseudouridine synthase a n=1 Tax=hydrocarbon metagenome TaxID=938273 RepID=A0A0W8FKI1_9ZZZZ|nr:tRNA pseudouridine(38-40) synthase TruA [Methanomicrobiaceae archaeon]